MPSLTIWTYLIVCPLIFLAGFVDSIAGGGGLISLPAYYLAGLPPSLAGGTNKLSAIMGTTVSTVKYAKNGYIDWQAGLLSLLGAIPGAMLGAFLLTWLPEIYVRAGVLLALPLVAVLVLRNKDLSPRPSLVPPRFTPLACFVIGLVVGTYDGLVGPGTGTFLILAYVMLLGKEALMASGTSKLINLGSNLGALITLMATGHVLYALALPAAAFGIAGNLLGASLAIKKGAPFVRLLLLVVLGLLLLKLLLDLLA
jgi:uncharacterized membrane protein YfcA